MARTGAFEHYSEQYENWFEKNREIYEWELEAVRRMLPHSGIGIEIGVGSGRFAAPLRITTGIEPCVEMAIIAKQKGISTAIGIAEQMPVRSHCCDFALMVTTICFVDSVLESFLEAKRILKPGGYLITGLVDSNSKLGQRYQERKDRSRFYAEATFYNADEVKDYMRQAGFENIEACQTLLEYENHDRKQIIPGTGKGAFVVIRAEAGYDRLS